MQLALGKSHMSEGRQGCLPDMRATQLKGDGHRGKLTVGVVAVGKELLPLLRRNQGGDPAARCHRERTPRVSCYMSLLRRVHSGGHLNANGATSATASSSTSAGAVRCTEERLAVGAAVVAGDATETKLGAALAAGTDCRATGAAW